MNNLGTCRNKSSGGSKEGSKVLQFIERLLVWALPPANICQCITKTINSAVCHLCLSSGRAADHRFNTPPPTPPTLVEHSPHPVSSGSTGLHAYWWTTIVFHEHVKKDESSRTVEDSVSFVWTLKEEKNETNSPKINISDKENLFRLVGSRGFTKNWSCLAASVQGSCSRFAKLQLHVRPRLGTRTPSFAPHWDIYSSGPRCRGEKI